MRSICQGTKLRDSSWFDSINFIPKFDSSRIIESLINYKRITRILKINKILFILFWNTGWLTISSDCIFWRTSTFPKIRTIKSVGAAKILLACFKESNLVGVATSGTLVPWDLSFRPHYWDVFLNTALWCPKCFWSKIYCEKQ